MILEKEKRELEKIKRQTNEPKDEERIVPVVENNGQFKIAIPRTFTNFLKYKKNEKKIAKVILIKKEKKLVIHIE